MATDPFLLTASSLSSQYLYVIALLLPAFLALRSLLSKKVRHPPGPRPLPIVGNSLQVPSEDMNSNYGLWDWMQDLGKVYGPVVHLTLGGDNVLVLNTPEAAEDILAKKGNNFSSRKHHVYAQQYRSKDKRLLLLPYNNALKKQRAAFHSMLQPRAVGTYERVQEFESKKFVYDLLTRPDLPAESHCQAFAASVVMSMAYGKRVEPNDPELIAVYDILRTFIPEIRPGGYLVDTFPILDKILPDSLAYWRAEASAKHDKEIAMYKQLISNVAKQMEKGVAPDCFASRMLEQQEKLGFDDTDVAYCVGTSFEAGTGNVASSINWFLLGLLCNPSVVAKAHEELDRVLGQDTPPTFAHFHELPWIRACVKEVLRWRPAAPGAFPHVNDVDDTYGDWDIPAGTQVISNIWAMHHNDERFPDSLSFSPERWMTKEEVSSESNDILIDGHWAFGFGRRICPGRYLAARSLFITYARILFYFDVKQDIDPKTGKEYTVDINWPATKGVNIEPAPFPVRFVPRSEAHAERIRSEWTEASAELAQRS